MVDGSDALKLAKQLNSQDIDKFILKNPTQITQQELKGWRNTFNKCNLVIAHNTDSNQSLFKKFATLFEGIDVYAAGRCVHTSSYDSQKLHHLFDKSQHMFEKVFGNEVLDPSNVSARETAAIKLAEQLHTAANKAVTGKNTVDVVMNGYTVRIIGFYDKDSDVIKLGTAYVLP